MPPLFHWFCSSSPSSLSLAQHVQGGGETGIGRRALRSGPIPRPFLSCVEPTGGLPCTCQLCSNFQADHQHLYNTVYKYVLYPTHCENFICFPHTFNMISSISPKLRDFDFLHLLNILNYFSYHFHPHEAIGVHNGSMESYGRHPSASGG